MASAPARLLLLRHLGQRDRDHDRQDWADHEGSDPHFERRFLEKGLSMGLHHFR